MKKIILILILILAASVWCDGIKFSGYDPNFYIGKDVIICDTGMTIGDLVAVVAKIDSVQTSRETRCYGFGVNTGGKVISIGRWDSETDSLWVRIKKIDYEKSNDITYCNAEKILTLHRDMNIIKYAIIAIILVAAIGFYVLLSFFARFIRSSLDTKEMFDLLDGKK